MNEPGATAQRVYAAMLAAYLANGYPASMRELSEMCHINVSTTYGHLCQLESFNWVRRGGNGKSRAWLPIKHRISLLLIDERTGGIYEPDVGQAPSADPPEKTELQ